MAAYFRPVDLDDALALLARQPLTVAAGCTDLFPATEARALPGDVLDITAIDGLRGIAETPEGWRIGAATRWRDVLAAPLPPGFDMLKQAAREVGSVQIQNAGTVAGNICNASPAADGVPPLLALGAEVELASAMGRRRLALGDFLTGPRRTALVSGEIVVALHVPRAAAAGRSRFRKLGARRYLVISIAMVAARVRADGRGCVAEAALAVGACGPVACRLPAVEAALTGQPLAAMAETVEERAVAASLAPIDDIRADAAYRAGAAARLLRDALQDIAAAARTGGAAGTEPGGAEG